MLVRPYLDSDHDSVVSLWNECGLVVPWNNPDHEIMLKRQVQDDLFLVGEYGQEVVATAMAGYDGHRGWLYLIGVQPRFQGRGFGRQIVEEAVRRLSALGCRKVNLQIRESNLQVRSFYERLGFQNDNVIGMGLRLQTPGNKPPSEIDA